MVTDFLDIETLKRALVGIKKKRRTLEHLMRPLREEDDNLTHQETYLARLVEVLGVNIHELYEKLEAEPLEIDLSQLMDTLAEKWLSMPSAPELLSVADAAYLALQSIGQPAHYKQIASTVRDKGYNIPGHDPESNLLAHMSNDKKRFAKAQEAGRGFWKLVEWDKREE